MLGVLLLLKSLAAESCERITLKWLARLWGSFKATLQNNKQQILEVSRQQFRLFFSFVLAPFKALLALCVFTCPFIIPPKKQNRKLETN